MNFFQGTLARDQRFAGFSRRNENGIALPLEGVLAQPLPARAGQAVTLGLRPEHIGEAAGGQVAAAVERVEAAGAENFFYCSGCGVPFVI